MYTHDWWVEAGVAGFVFSYCQVYKYRRFRTVRQNTSGWRGVAGGGKELGRRSGVYVCVSSSSGRRKVL